jgi:hypothetical protein
LTDAAAADWVELDRLDRWEMVQYADELHGDEFDIVSEIHSDGVVIRGIYRED